MGADDDIAFAEFCSIAADLQNEDRDLVDIVDRLDRLVERLAPQLTAADWEAIRKLDEEFAKEFGEEVRYIKPPQNA